MNPEIELYCKEHELVITHVSQTFINGSYARCKKCDMSNQDLILIDEFLSSVKKLRKEMVEKEETVVKKYNQDSEPLRQCLENFCVDLEKQKKQILLSIQKIPNKVKSEYSGKIPFNEASPSLSSLQETCATLRQTMDFSKIKQIEQDSPLLIQTFEQKKKQTNFFLETSKLLSDFGKMCSYYIQLILEALKQIQTNTCPNYEAGISQKLPQINSYCTPTMALNNDVIQPTLALGIPNSITLYKILPSNSFLEFEKIETKFTPKSLFFSDDDQLLVSIENDTQIHFFQKKENKYQKQSRLYFQQCQSLNSLVISKGNDEIIANCGNLLYNISLDRVLNQKNYKVEEEGLNGHTQTINQISYNQGQDKLISCSSDKTVIIWQKQIDKETKIQTWRIAQKMYLTESVLNCCFIMDTQFIVLCNTERYLRLFEQKNKGNYGEIRQLTLDSSARWECNNQQFKYDMNTKLLVVKGNGVVYLIQNKGNSNYFRIEQKINGKFILANSNNHSHTALWNIDSQQLQIYKPGQQKKLEKSKFEQKYFN